jgi:hypothetical protein
VAIPVTRVTEKMVLSLLFCGLALALPGAQDQLLAATLQPQTVKAWDQYLAWADAKVSREVGEKGRLLIRDRLSPKDRSEYDRALRNGEVYLAKMSSVVPKGVHFDVPDGTIYHWWGAVLVPNVKLAELLVGLQDYDHHAGRFAEVERSRLVAKTGNTYMFTFRLKRVKYGISAYYNTDQECTYYPLAPNREWSRSVATRIAEIADAGKPEEHDKPVGDDRGYLWRMVSWWRFQEVANGVTVECESATLSRGIPWGLGWGLGPIIEKIARESLESVLLTVRGFGKAR